MGTLLDEIKGKVSKKYVDRMKEIVFVLDVNLKHTFTYLTDRQSFLDILKDTERLSTSPERVVSTTFKLLHGNITQTQTTLVRVHGNFAVVLVEFLKSIPDSSDVERELHLVAYEGREQYDRLHHKISG